MQWNNSSYNLTDSVRVIAKHNKQLSTNKNPFKKITDLRLLLSAAFARKVLLDTNKTAFKTC